LVELTGELEDLGSEVLKDGSSVHGGGGTDTLRRGHTDLEEPVDTADRELSRAKYVSANLNLRQNASRT
jgi:hypothetical protein